jgi:hypothetical protein
MNRIQAFSIQTKTGFVWMRFGCNSIILGELSGCLDKCCNKRTGGESCLPTVGVSGFPYGYSLIYILATEEVELNTRSLNQVDAIHRPWPVSSLRPALLVMPMGRRAIL